MLIRALGVAVVLTLALTSCGQDEEAASKAISDSVMKSNDETFKVTQGEADCIGDGMVESIGVDKLTDYGIITEDLKADNGLESVEMSEGDAGSAADVMSECADIKKLFTSAMGDLPEEAQQCVDEKLSDEVLHDFLVSIFMNEQEQGQQELVGALGECISAGG